MRIQYLNGGLGNQIFQYIFKRYMEISAGEKVWLDDMKFFKVNEHNGYELSKVFGVSENDLLSHYFDPDIWEYMVGKSPVTVSNLCQQLKDAGEDIVMIAETLNYEFDGTVVKVPASRYLPSIELSKGNLYFFGYWICKEWMEAIKPVIMQELHFPDFSEELNLQYAHRISTEDSISVHIRRGDFIKIGIDLPMQFYRDGLEQMLARMPGAKCFVFSDDIGWCKENYRELGLNLTGDRLTFVTNNVGEAAYRDMQLMSMCRGMIIANSAFSYFAALYNQNENKLVFNPIPQREI